jgi:ABC-type phosphate transport system permease subunit
LYLSALFEIGLVLLGVTVLVNIIAQLLLKTFAGPCQTAALKK